MGLDYHVDEPTSHEQYEAGQRQGKIFVVGIHGLSDGELASIVWDIAEGLTTIKGAIDSERAYLSNLLEDRIKEVGIEGLKREELQALYEALKTKDLRVKVVREAQLAYLRSERPLRALVNK